MAHLYSVYKCNLCKEIPERAPLFNCPHHKHHYCSECFENIQKKYGSHNQEDLYCPLCKIKGKFEINSSANSDFLKKLKSRKHLKKPFSLQTIRLSNDSLLASDNVGDYLVELVEKTQSLELLKNAQTSRKPVICLHRNCNKHTAISKLMTHYKHDHVDVPRLCIERNQELSLIFDATAIEYELTICLTLFTVYEINQIDVTQSKSSTSVIKACRKFSGKCPLNTFWLMLTVSKYCCSSFAVFWLYSNSTDDYFCTLELASKNDKIVMTTFCRCIGLHEINEGSSDELATNLNCLYVSKGSFLSLLKEDPEINLRITVH